MARASVVASTGDMVCESSRDTATTTAMSTSSKVMDMLQGVFGCVKGDRKRRGKKDSEISLYSGLIPTPKGHGPHRREDGSRTWPSTATSKDTPAYGAGTGVCCPRCPCRNTPSSVMLHGCVPLPMVSLRPQDLSAFSQVTMDRVKGVFIGLVLENDQAGNAHRSGQYPQELRMLSPHGGFCTAYPTTFTSGPSPMLMVEPLITPWAFPAGVTDNSPRPSPQPSPPPAAVQPCSHGSGDSGFSECWCPRDPGTSWDAPKDKPSNSKAGAMDHTCAEQMVVRLPPLQSEQNLPEASQEMNPAARSALNKCGFYYPGLSNDSARRALKAMAVGTFLLRDSSHPGYMLSLTAVTPRGTTSVRLEYREGMFRVDTASWRGDIPSFSCPIRLLQYYISTPCVFTESSGRRDTKVLLHRPLRHTVLSLADLARRTVHKNTRPEDVNWLSLPPRTRKYLIEYPYWL